MDHCSKKLISNTVNGIQLPSKTAAKNLGHSNTGQRFNIDYSMILDKYVATINVICKMFPKVQNNVKYNMCKILAANFYGCQIWNLNENKLKEIKVTWRKCVRRILCISPRSHSRFLPLCIMY